MDDFNQILNNLLSTESEFRSKAEKIYENINAKDKVQFLFLAICDDSKTEEQRQLAAILMRRVLFKSFDEISKAADDNFMVQLKNHILAIIQREDVSMILRKKICDIISELSTKFIDDDGNNLWPELLSFMFNAANSPILELRECSLNILNSFPSIFANDQNKYLDFIKKMLLKCLCEESNDQVKLAALKATTAFILVNSEDKSIVKFMSETILPMLQIMNVLVEQDEDQPFLSFIELAEKCTPILRPHFTSLMDICMKTITNNEYSDNLRHAALEIIISYSESAASTFRKRGTNYLIPLVTQLLLMMTDLEEDDNWSFNENEDDDDDSNSNHIVGETALDRLACALGGKIVFPIAINIISQMLQNADWKQRYAALMAISALGEGCKKQMQPMLDQIVGHIITFVGDSHPRVRYALCNAMGQMSSDFAPQFQQQFHDKFVPNMLLLLDDNQNPRVQAHAGAAFVNFFEDSRQKHVLPYLNSIVDKFEQVLKVAMEELMKKGSKLILEQIVVSIASLADLIQELFTNYYDRFMPCLKFIIENANANKEYRLLRGKAIECASLIGLAVGGDKFCNDASQIMTLLLQTQTGELVLEDDDPQLSYMITSWVRICKLLGSKFEPYLPMVMPQVLKTASLTAEMTVLDEDEVGSYENSGDWKFFSINDQQNLGIKVSGLEDKATACEMLVCYARELKHGFVNYLEDTVKILVPLLKFYLHEGVRTAAAESLPCLLDCAKIRGDNYVRELWNFIFPALLEAMEKENENEVLSEMLVSLGECITSLGIHSLNEQQMETLVKVIDQLLVEYFERSKERQERRQDEDYDDGTEEALNNEDDDEIFLLIKFVDVLHSLFVAYNEKFLPFFNHFLIKHFVNMVTPDKPVAYLQYAICVMDDLIEFCGTKCIDYQDFFLPLLITNLKNPDPEVRQGAAYGMGVLAKHGGESFAKVLSENIPVLVAMIQDPNARFSENLYATENAISAITKIIQYNSTMIDVDSLLPCWITWLPIWEDEEEVVYVYSFLYQLLESNHQPIFGNDNCNLPHILSSILEVFARSVIEPASELGQKLITYVKFAIQSCHDQSLLSKFTPEQQKALEEISKV